MRLKFEIASDDTLTVVDSEFEAETVEVSREGDKLVIHVVVDIPLETDHGDIYE